MTALPIDLHRHLSIYRYVYMYACMLGKEMAAHSSVLAWRIPGMGEPGGLPSMGSHRVGHDCSDLAAAAEYLKVTLSIGNFSF